LCLANRSGDESWTFGSYIWEMSAWSLTNACTEAWAAPVPLPFHWREVPDDPPPSFVCCGRDPGQLPSVYDWSSGGCSELLDAVSARRTIRVNGLTSSGAPSLLATISVRSLEGMGSTLAVTGADRSSPTVAVVGRQPPLKFTEVTYLVDSVSTGTMMTHVTAPHVQTEMKMTCVGQTARVER
jgi:hypothetical protein